MGLKEIIYGMKRERIFTEGNEWGGGNLPSAQDEPMGYIHIWRRKTY